MLKLSFQPFKYCPGYSVSNLGKLILLDLAISPKIKVGLWTVSGCMGFLVDLHAHSVKFRFVFASFTRNYQICLRCFQSLYFLCIVHGCGQSVVLHLLGGASADLGNLVVLAFCHGCQIMQSISFLCDRQVCWLRVVCLRWRLTHQNVLWLCSKCNLHWLRGASTSFGKCGRLDFLIIHVHQTYKTNNEHVYYSCPCYTMDFQS